MTRKLFKTIQKMKKKKTTFEEDIKKNCLITDREQFIENMMPFSSNFKKKFIIKKSMVLFPPRETLNAMLFLAK